MSSSGGIVSQPTLGSIATVATADAATTIAADNAPHTLACVMASPPAWLNVSGAITAAGVYAITLRLAAGVAPTVVNRLVGIAGVAGESDDNLTAITAAGAVTRQRIVALGAADVPLVTTCTVTAQTDATATLTGRVSVQRLAIPAT